jgi:hypothetical protein
MSLGDARTGNDDEGKGGVIILASKDLKQHKG